MAEITMRRSIAVGDAITKLIEAFNSITEEELKALIEVGEHKHTVEPFIDPTRYRQESHSITQGQTVLRGMLRFKQAVKGIGYFN